MRGLHQSLEQELFALLRGASLECLVCGEFILYRRNEICCPECGMTVPRDKVQAKNELDFGMQAG